MTVNTEHGVGCVFTVTPAERKAFCEAVETFYDVSALLNLVGRGDEMGDGLPDTEAEKLTCTIARVARHAEQLTYDALEKMEVFERRFRS